MLRREMTATHHYRPQSSDPGVARRYGLPQVREIHRVTAHPMTRGADTPASPVGDRRSPLVRVASGDAR
jgi:hypothetical protein